MHQGMPIGNLEASKIDPAGIIAFESGLLAMNGRYNAINNYGVT
jgi:hypothetical protein